MIIVCTFESRATSSIKEISSRFSVGECSELNWFLGMNFEFKEDKIEVSQQAYICEILRKFGF